MKVNPCYINFVMIPDFLKGRYLIKEQHLFIQLTFYLLFSTYI